MRLQQTEGLKACGATKAVWPGLRESVERKVGRAMEVLGGQQGCWSQVKNVLQASGAQQMEKEKESDSDSDTM